MSTLLNTRTPRARKAHRCDLCNCTIQPGEVYDRTTWVVGRPVDWIRCAGCMNDNVASLVYAQVDDDDGITYTDAYEWASDCALDRLSDDPGEIAAAVRWLKRAGVTL